MSRYQDVSMVIEGYSLNVKLKEVGGVYYAKSDLFFPVGAVGESPEDAVERTKVLFLRLREVCYTKMLQEYGIEKSKPI